MRHALRRIPLLAHPSATQAQQGVRKRRGEVREGHQGPPGQGEEAAALARRLRRRPGRQAAAPPLAEPKRRADPSSFESQALHNNAAFIGRLKPPYPHDAPRARPRAPPPHANADPSRERACFDFILGAHNYGTPAASKRPAYWPTRDVQCCGSRAEIRFLLSQVGLGNNGVPVMGALQHASVLRFDPVTGKASLVYRVEEPFAPLLKEDDLPHLSVGAVVRFPGCHVLDSAADASRCRTRAALCRWWRST